MLDNVHWTLWNAKKLPDGHGAEDVEEDEAAISHVLSQQVSVAQPLKDLLVKLGKQKGRTWIQ